MNKKKFLIIILILSLITLVSCGKTSNANNEESPNTETIITDKPIGAGMANPITVVDDVSKFEETCGISLDLIWFPEERSLSIINNEVCEVRYNSYDPDGKEVPCILRATKEKDLVETMHGYYASDWDEPYEIEQGIIKITCTYSKTLNVTLYTWDFNDVYYSFGVEGNLSQMTIASLMDQNMVACGYAN